MAPEEICEPLRDALQGRPFLGFRLQLTDGTRMDITHPECLAFHPKSPLTRLIALSDGGLKALDLLLVTTLHVDNRTQQRKKYRIGSEVGPLVHG